MTDPSSPETPTPPPATGEQTKKCPQCGKPVPPNPQGRKRIFDTRECSIAYNNAKRTGAGTSPRWSPPGIVDLLADRADPWTVALQQAKNQVALLAQLHADHLNLAPDSVRAQLAEAQATATGAIKRARLAETSRDEALEETDRRIEGFEAEVAEALDDRDRAREAAAEAADRLTVVERELGELREAAAHVDDRHRAEIERLAAIQDQMRTQADTLTRERDTAQAAHQAAVDRTARLETELEQARADVRRADEHAEHLTGNVDRLTGELRAAHAETTRIRDLGQATAERLTADVERHAAELAAIRKSVQTAEARYTADLEDARNRVSAADEHARQAHDQAREDARAAAERHAAEVAALRDQAREDARNAAERHSAEIAAMRKEVRDSADRHTAETTALREEARAGEDRGRQAAAAATARADRLEGQLAAALARVAAVEAQLGQQAGTTTK